MFVCWNTGISLLARRFELVVSVNAGEGRGRGPRPHEADEAVAGRTTDVSSLFSSTLFVDDIAKV